MKNDLDFISRRYETIELPGDKQYLLKYFDTEVQAAYVKYVYVFGSDENFSDHTGIPCTRKWLAHLSARLKSLESTYRAAKSSLTEENLEIVARIEKGRWKPKKSQKSGGE